MLMYRLGCRRVEFGEIAIDDIELHIHAEDEIEEENNSNEEHSISPSLEAEDIRGHIRDARVEDDDEDRGPDAGPEEKLSVADDTVMETEYGSGASEDDEEYGEKLYGGHIFFYISFLSSSLQPILMKPIDDWPFAFE